MDNKSPSQRQAERLKYARIQRYIRLGALLLAMLLSIISLSQSCATQKAISELAAQLKAKKLAEAQAALQSEAESQEEETVVTVSGTAVTLCFAGACTLADDENTAYADSLTQYYDSYGASYFFQNVKSIFEGADLTVACLNSTLSTSGARADQDKAYRADPSYAAILTGGSVNAVSVIGAHVHDYGNESYVDTLATLDNYNITRFGSDYSQLVTLTGTLVGDTSETTEESDPTQVLVGLVGVWEEEDDYVNVALETMEELQDKGAQLLVVMLYWSSQEADQPDESQIKLAHDLIDAGADLIIGIQPGVLQGVECYHGRYIAYSLGSLLAEGEVQDTMIFRQTFILSDGECVDNAAYEITPCLTASGEDSNDFCPTLATGAAAQRILDTIYTCSDLLDGGIRLTEE